jgi:hypothetical protein
MFLCFFLARQEHQFRENDILASVHNACQTLVLAWNSIATEPAGWRHPSGIQMAIEHSPKRLSGFTKLKEDRLDDRSFRLCTTSGCYMWLLAY